MFVDFFIKRPVFATVCALLIILAGSAVIPTLPIAQFPTLAPPQVSVTSVYVGASAQTVETAVTVPLEQQINGAEGMKYVTSTSSSNGVSTITATFDLNRDPDLAAVDIQNRVNTAQGRLPNAVKATGITIVKASSNFVFGAAVFSPEGRYTPLFMSNYLDVYVKDSLKRVPGVADVIIFGERKYSMRLWLDPVRMASRGLTATDAVSALQEQNVDVAAGQVGQPPIKAGQEFQISVRAIGRLTEASQFENIILKTNSDGTLVRLKDVGRAELGAEDYSSDLMFNGREAVGLGVTQLSSANALEVDRLVIAELDRLSTHFPPGMKYQNAFDTTEAVSESIRDVLTTLIEAIVLVILVIFIFLQDWRSTIIPAVTIPVSLIGTFAFVKLLGIFRQYADPVRHHSGHRTGGGRRHRCDREHRTPHSGRRERHSQGRLRRHVGSGGSGHRHLAGAGRGVCAGGVFPRHHRHSVSPVRADHRVLDFDFRLQRADAYARPVCHPAGPRARREELVLQASGQSH